MKVLCEYKSPFIQRAMIAVTLLLSIRLVGLPVVIAWRWAVWVRRSFVPGKLPTK
jgi:hypothetical protein